MTVFSYSARDEKGSAISGTVEAASIDLAGTQLDSLGYIPIVIKEQAASPFLDIAEFFARSIPPEDIIFFTFQISTLIGAGVPLLESLKTIALQMKNEQFKKFWNRRAGTSRRQQPVRKPGQTPQTVAPEFMSI